MLNRVYIFYLTIKNMDLNKKLPFTNINWISAAILKEPEKAVKKIRKGALVLGMVDEIISFFPRIRDLFYIIEWRGWSGLNYAKNADIKLVEDGSTLEETKRKFPKAISLDLAVGDFVDTDKFRPLDTNKLYDIIQIASWVPFKRHELFLEAASLLPSYTFIKFGHLPSQSSDEVFLKRKILERFRVEVPNVYLPFSQSERNDDLPYVPKEVNGYLNSAKVGVLTSSKEGMNRFKMECLSAGLPFLVAKDSVYPIKKHINERTGAIYEPTPRGLAKAIEETVSNLDKFLPRDYILRNTGKKNSTLKLENALNQLALRDGNPEYFEGLNFGGRNQDFLWGYKALESLRKLVGGFYEQ